MKPVERAIVQCTACGKDIERRITDLARNTSGRFFCDLECRMKVGPKPRRRAMRACKQCGEEFYPMWAAEAQFCKKDCYDEFQRRRRVERTCENCGDTFWIKPSQLANITGRFCKRSCQLEKSIKRPAGRKHNGRQAKIDNSGYVWVYEPEHPNANRGGWVAEHRLVAEKALGRLLTPDDHVHHVNRIKTDNRPENLQVMGHLEHASITGLDIQQRLREWEEYRRQHGPLET